MDFLFIFQIFLLNWHICPIGLPIFRIGFVYQVSGRTNPPNKESRLAPSEATWPPNPLPGYTPTISQLFPTIFHSF